MATPAGINYRVRVGAATGIAGVSAQARASIIKRIAEGTVKRVQERVRHPATRSLRSRGTNQWSADIYGPRGGPGIIRPVRAKVLAFKVKGVQVFARSVNSPGLEPLINAEAARLTAVELGNLNDPRIT